MGKKKRGRPKSGGETPRRTMRVSDDAWALLTEAAEFEGISTTAYILRAATLAARETLRNKREAEEA